VVVVSVTSVEVSNGIASACDKNMLRHTAASRAIKLNLINRDIVEAKKISSRYETSKN